MTAEVTKGIKVSVETYYQDGQSDPTKSQYFFAYRVTIENYSGETVQLLRRHWHIFDSNGSKTEVEGEGVIGKQPILDPGEIHQYVSGCNLSTEFGKMWGTYLMKYTKTGAEFYVRIPEFTMNAPFKLN
jgi:ApaG protein